MNPLSREKEKEEMEKVSSKLSKSLIIMVIAILLLPVYVFLGALGYYYLKHYDQNEKTQQLVQEGEILRLREETRKTNEQNYYIRGSQEEAEKINSVEIRIEPKNVSLEKCSFKQKVELKESDSYDIMGGAEFDTVVCGHFATFKEEVWGEEFDGAYFKVEEFENSKFKEEVMKVAEGGNTINKTKDGEVFLNLGCYQYGKIVGIDYGEEDPYIDSNSLNKIINSTPENPIAVKFSFKKHLGLGCDCCNLAYRALVLE